MEWLWLVVGFYCTTNILANPLQGPRDEIYEVNELRSKIKGKQTGYEEECPNTEECMMKCPLGYQKDELGCPICEQCVTEGTFESDIVVDSRSYGTLLRQYGVSCDMDDGVTPRGAMASKDQQWPSENGRVRVPYTFHSSIGDKTYKMILRAMKEYHDKTCIRFVKRTTDRNYIEFVSASGCKSYIGMIGGKQQVWISEGCDVQIGTSLHELMHALGFWHEQSRGDRNKHVKVIWENILPDFKENFDKQSQDAWNSFGSAYDFNSVMHYGGYFFSKQYKVLPTIVNKLTNKPVVSQREGFSTQDLFQINKKYGCTAYLISEGAGYGQTHKVLTTTPMITTASTKAPALNGECVDNTTACDWYLERGYCETTPYIATVLCPKTCKHCKVAKTCVDNYPGSCLVWKKYCKSLTAFMEINCNKTCGLCQTEETTASSTCVDFSPICPTSAAKCKKNPKTMKKFCKKSCGYCGKTTATNQVQCGKRAVAHRKRIIGGMNVQYKSRPWVAHIFLPSGKSICGGTLISEKFIVTAAHCFKRTKYRNFYKYFAYLGKHHFSVTIYDAGELRVNIRRGTIHPNYNRRTHDNDIAIVELKRKVTYTDYIRPLCLPPAWEEPISNSLAVVSGWGMTNTSSTVTNSMVLMEANVRIIDRNICNAWLYQSQYVYQAVSQNMFCAGHQHGGKDACQGDSGGPLEQVKGDSSYLVGVVSWGYGCGEKQKPGVYTQVSRKVDWIKSIIAA